MFAIDNKQVYIYLLRYFNKNMLSNISLQIIYFTDK